MPVTRRFLVAPALTRLVHRQLGAQRIEEGHFAAQSERHSHVHIDTDRSFLVLTSVGESSLEERTEIPRQHAEALRQVCAGTLTYERSRVRLPDHDALVDRFFAPAAQHIVSVEFASEAEAVAFDPPVWFGAEVTSDSGYSNRSMAQFGMAPAREAETSNAALEALLDIIEGAITGRSDRESRMVVAQEQTVERLPELATRRSVETSAGKPITPDSRKAGRTKLRRPASVKSIEDTERQLASVIEGLSAALADGSPDAAAKARQSGWRWSRS